MNNRIREIRKANKMTQPALAEKLGLTKNYISLIETGERVPSERTVRDIATLFGVNENWLLTGEGDMLEPASREEELAQIAIDAFNSNDPMRIALLKTVTSLNSHQMEIIYNLARDLVEAHQKSSPEDGEP